MTIQIGVIAMRDPKTGAFMDAKPLYSDKESDIEARERMIRDAGKLFASWLEEAH